LTHQQHKGYTIIEDRKRKRESERSERKREKFSYH
jgi:hypothetical protein